VRDSKEDLAWDGGFDHYLVKKEVQSAPEVKPKEVSVTEDGLSSRSWTTCALEGYFVNQKWLTLGLSAPMLNLLG
jgi:hypothetical protein